MIEPCVPSWFSKKLRQLNPHFSAKWIAAKKCWAIMEAVRWSRYETILEGVSVYTIYRRPQRGIYVGELGSRVFEMLKRQDPRRFNSLQQVIDGLDIDKDQDDYRPANSFLA